MIDAKTWMGAVEKSYQFYAYVFTLYVILMGVMRWYGQTTWYKREQARRAERELPVASLVSNADTERGFSYSALFRGGLTGIRIVAGLLGWVVAMHIFSIFEDGLTSTSSDWFWTGISILMFFPITTGIVHVAMLVFPHKDHLRLLDYVRPTVIVVLSLIGTVAAVWTIQDKQIVVICQLVAVFVISLLIFRAWRLVYGHRPRETAATERGGGGGRPGEPAH